jgi:hypothetical protein
MYVVPNEDIHDATNSTADAPVRRWMRRGLSSSSYSQDAIVVLTWNEGSCDKVATIVVTSSNHRTHLSTIGNHFGLARDRGEVRKRVPYGVGRPGQRIPIALMKP